MFLGNLINGVNAILWGDNVIIKIPVWCDISTFSFVAVAFPPDDMFSDEDPNWEQRGFARSDSLSLHSA